MKIGVLGRLQVVLGLFLKSAAPLTWWVIIRISIFEGKMGVLARHGQDLFRHIQPLGKNRTSERRKKGVRTPTESSIGTESACLIS